MPFEVADSVDPGDGNGRRDPRKSLAGEVLKKKLQLNKNIVPPPAIQGSLSPEPSLLENQPEGDGGWDEEEDHYITKNIPFQRPSNTLSAPNRIGSSFVSSSNETSKTLTTLSVPEFITAIKDLLGRSPHLKPYIRYKLPLERKANGYFEFPISPIFYKDSCEICLDHGEACTIDRGESTSKCAACARFGGKCIFVNLEGIAPRKSETHLNCGRCALRLGICDCPGFKKFKQPFSPSKFLELSNQVPAELPMKELKQKLEKELLGEGRQRSSNQQGVLMRAIPSSSEDCSSEEVMMSEEFSLDRSDPKVQNCSIFPTRIGMAPTLSKGSIYKPPSEAGLAAWSSTSKSSSSDQSIETSSLSSKQNLASDSDNGHSGGLDAKWHPSLLQATTTTSASTYSSEPIAESIVNPSSQKLSENLVRDSLVKGDTENRSNKLPERRRRRIIEHQNRRRAEYEARNTATESNMNRLASLFAQPRSRLFESETSRISPTDNETFQPWLENRGLAEEIPYEATKCLFPSKTMLRQRQLELIKTTEKVYIPHGGSYHTPDLREAREQLRYGFVEGQGGELSVRRETSDNEDEDDYEKIEEQLTTEQYWKRRVKEEHNSVQGFFWEHEPRRHR
jgi:hypothetical protein